MTLDIQGFPIRKSTDQRSFTNSPWLIAGYNVLHRLLVPRHPPIALSSLLFTTKMLASTVKFSKYGRTQPNTHQRRRQHQTARSNHCKHSRNSRTQQRAQAPPPTTTFHTPNTRQYSTQPTAKLTHQCSTNRCSPARRHTLLQPAHEPPPTPQGQQQPLSSLERR